MVSGGGGRGGRRADGGRCSGPEVQSWLQRRRSPLRGIGGESRACPLTTGETERGAMEEKVGASTHWVSRLSRFGGWPARTCMYAHWRIERMLLVAAMPLLAIRIFRIGRLPPRDLTKRDTASSTRTSARSGAATMVGTAGPAAHLSATRAQSA